MRDDINQALKIAMKAKDKRRVSTLRLINAAIKDRDIAVRSEDRMEGVTDDEILLILAKMIKQRHESVTMYEDGGRHELAQQEREEIDIISEYLPRQLDDEEIRSVCGEVVGEIGAAGLKDMGRTMGELKKRYAGEMDFGKASGFVKELLS